jgi:hypothetical protein
MAIQIRSYPPMPTRPCQYGLALQDDSVFADFNADENGCLYLVRISFDGYGCCYPDPEKELHKISADSSKRLVKQIETDSFAYPEASEIIRAYLWTIREAIWEDALRHHEII